MRTLRLTTTFVLSAVCFLLYATSAAACGVASEPVTTVKIKSTPEIEAIVQEFEKANPEQDEEKEVEQLQIPEKYLEPADSAGVRKIKNFAKVNQAINLFIARVNNPKDGAVDECRPKVIYRDELKLDLSTQGRDPDSKLIPRHGKLVFLKAVAEGEVSLNKPSTVLMSPNNTDWYLLPIEEAGWSPKAEVFISHFQFELLVTSVNYADAGVKVPTMFDLQFFIDEAGTIEFAAAKLIGLD